MSYLQDMNVAVDGGWLWERLNALAAIGGRQDGGVSRSALSEGERQAIGLIAGWADELGCRIFSDAIGNVFVRRDGIEDLPPVVTGSHIDTQPVGGRYDGTYGVVAGLATIEALHRTGTLHRRPIEVVAWTNEEGSRFAPGAMGSAAFMGFEDVDVLRERRDCDGVSLGKELDRNLAALESLGAEQRAFGMPFHAFVEAHIEQGPLLEEAETPIGIVEGVQGLAWYRFDVEGVAAHAGTTPLEGRHDAFLGASELAANLRQAAIKASPQVRFTIGRFEVLPGSPNTIPNHVGFFVDLRHFAPDVLDGLHRIFTDLCNGVWQGCTISMSRQMRIEPVQFSQMVTNELEVSARRLKVPFTRLRSGAFHDAAHLAAHCPTSMLFIPCKNGISHHPDESIKFSDAEIGGRVLAHSVLSLANS